MSARSRSLRQFGRETTADPAATERVKRRLAVEVPDADARRAMLEQLPSPAPGAEMRVRVRLAAWRPAPRLALPVFTAGALAAAAALLLVPRGGPTSIVPARLESPQAVAQVRASDGVELTLKGSGALSGTAEAPRVDWDAGTLQVEVEPDRGIALAVHTREATVRVIGTGFTVTRDVLGTAIAVRHGRVAVSCTTGDGATLAAGDAHTCLPVSAAGLLARARVLEAGDAGADRVLATAERGLAGDDASAAVRGELLATRMRALDTLGRTAVAAEAARAYLAEGHAPRAADAHRLLARVELARGCAPALPHLRALAEAAPRPEELARLGDCLADIDPAGAVAAWTAALDLGMPEAEADALRRRME